MMCGVVRAIEIVGEHLNRMQRLYNVSTHSVCVAAQHADQCIQIRFATIAKLRNDKVQLHTESTLTHT